MDAVEFWPRDSAPSQPGKEDQGPKLMLLCLSETPWQLSRHVLSWGQVELLGLPAFWAQLLRVAWQDLQDLAVCKKPRQF